MENDAVTQILGRLGIDYGPALTNMKIFEREVARHSGTIASQFERIQKQMNITGSSSMFAGNLTKDKIILDQHGRELLRVQGQLTNQTAAAATARLASQRSANRQSEQEALRHMSRIGELSSQMERRMGWFGAGLMFYGAQDAFRQTLNAIGEVEMGMTAIARIQDDPSFNFEKVRQNIIDLGKEFGQQWNVVQDIFLRWSQAGYDTAEAIELTRTSLLALNTAELNSAQSTQQMIAVMSQWNLESKDLMGVLDMVNKTADEYAITSAELLDGLVRSSGAAKVLKMNLEETIAVLTTMREASGRTGREVGNALNSILSYMQRPKAINAFESAGIKIWADEAKTEYRSVMEVFSELSERWTGLGPEIQEAFVESADAAGLFASELDVLSDAEKTELAQAGAGVYRRNYLIALLERWGVTTKVLTDIEKSHGYSLAENERTMETYQKRVESLRMATTELAVSVGEAGLLGVMKGLVDGTREGIEAFRGLPEPVQESILILLGLSGALVTVNLGFRVFMGMGIGGMLISLAAHIAGVEAATLGLGRALMILQAQPLLRFIALIGAAAAGLALYNHRQQESIQETMNFLNSTESSVKGIQQEIDKINDLVSEHESFANQTELTTEQKNRLKVVTKEIVDIMPSAISGYNQAGDAIVTLGSVSESSALKLSSLNDAMREQAKLAAVVAGAELPKLKEKMSEAMGKGEQAAEALRSGDYSFESLAGITPAPFWNVKENLQRLNEGYVKEQLTGIARDQGKVIGELNQAITGAETAIKTWNTIEAGGLQVSQSRGTGTSRAPSSGGKPASSVPSNNNQTTIPDFAALLKGMANELTLGLTPYDDTVFLVDDEVITICR